MTVNPRPHTTTHKPYWAARDWAQGMAAAYHLADMDAIRVLREHDLFAHHCGGYDVLAWPCPTAAAVLDRLWEARQ